MQLTSPHVEAGQGGSPGEIGDDSAHHIMRGGCDQNAFPSRIDAPRLAHGEDAWETSRERPAERSGVEPDARPALLFTKDLARDDVARGEIDEPMTPRHEAHAAIVHQRCPFAAHRFGDELQGILRCVECGRMKLHELHVGEAHAGTMRDREAVAGRHLGVGRVAVGLAASTSREHGRVCENLHGAARHARPGADALALAHDEVERPRELDDANIRTGSDALDQRARHFRAGLVAVRVHDALARVRRLLAEREAAAAVGIELRAERGKVAHPLRPLGDEHGDGIGIAERRRAPGGVQARHA